MSNCTDRDNDINLIDLKVDEDTKDDSGDDGYADEEEPLIFDFCQLKLIQTPISEM
jgi:hypothetical protein